MCCLTEDGAQVRVPDGMPGKVRDMVDHELSLITDLGHETYFLTVYDIMRFTHERGILCQGCGSAAQLNSQPLCFYQPSQLIQDATRQRGEVRATAVLVSAWDSALEESGASQPAVRLGLSLVSGLSEAGAERLVAARSTAPFRDAEDLARWAALDRKDMPALAQSGARAALSGHGGMCSNRSPG